jgi:heat shock protein HtpX
MAEVLSAKQVPTVSGRSAENWLSHALVVSLLALALAPFVLAVGYIASVTVVGMIGNGSRQASTQVQDTAQSQDSGRGSVDWLERGPIGSLTASAENRTSDQNLVLKLLPVTILLFAAGLGLLLWGLSASTTANLLARIGARPAASEGRERDAVRAIEKFALCAGVPTPKLYVIQCGFPTTFSSAADARNSMVAITSGALDLLQARELNALLAHEITHIASRDSRLDAILAALKVVTEYPFRMFRRQMSSAGPKKVSLRHKLALLEIALSPLGLYIFFVSPILNRMIAALVLQGREFSADINATLLTGNPEDLVYALAKIGGVTKVLGKSAVASMPAQADVSERIERVMSLYGVYSFNGLKDAIARGKRYAEERPGIGDDLLGIGGAHDHLSSIKQGNVMGRVYRVIANEHVSVFDKAGPGALLRLKVKPGAMIVAFDTPGIMRQVNTAEEVFGYISHDVRLEPVPGVLPQEIYDPKARAAAEEVLARQERQRTSRGASGKPAGNLTRQQVWIAVGFSAAVFLGTTIILFVFVGR